jgi:outer membrane protein OmpA-like peptidoglycan-associated protein
MLGRIVLKRSSKHEGESPFWISFSDLMSALMTLFLVVMAVTLIAVTKNVTALEEKKIQREKDIRTLMIQIRKESELMKVNVDESTYRIDMDDRVRFDSGASTIKSGDAKFLRSYIPVLLRSVSSLEGERWVRRVVVEGFTDQDGTYLYNLGLSLNRSRSVVCVLFEKPILDEVALSDVQKKQIRDLFLVGGYSFNSIRKEKSESRRVELKLEFWGIDEKKPDAISAAEGKEIGQC